MKKMVTLLEIFIVNKNFDDEEDRPGDKTNLEETMKTE